jgi:hypothetical protein
MACGMGADGPYSEEIPVAVVVFGDGMGERAEKGDIQAKSIFVSRSKERSAAIRQTCHMRS